MKRQYEHGVGHSHVVQVFLDFLLHVILEVSDGGRSVEARTGIRDLVLSSISTEGIATYQRRTS